MKPYMISKRKIHDTEYSSTVWIAQVEDKQHIALAAVPCDLLIGFPV